MEQRVSLITLGVADAGRARAFYERLGWKGMSPDDDVVFFQAGGMIVALWARHKLAEDSAVTDGGGWGGITLAHNVASPEAVDAVLAEAEAAGATIGRRGAPKQANVALAASPAIAPEMTPQMRSVSLLPRRNSTQAPATAPSQEVARTKYMTNGPVTAGVLGGVEGGVGPFDHLVVGAAGAADADGDGDRHAEVAADGGDRHGPPDAFAHVGGAVDAAVGQDHDELLAAPAADDVLDPGRPGDPPGDLP